MRSSSFVRITNTTQMSAAGTAQAPSRARSGSRMPAGECRRTSDAARTGTGRPRRPLSAVVLDSRVRREKRVRDEAPGDDRAGDEQSDSAGRLDRRRNWSPAIPPRVERGDDDHDEQQDRIHAHQRAVPAFRPRFCGAALFEQRGIVLRHPHAAERDPGYEERGHQPSGPPVETACRREENGLHHCDDRKASCRRLHVPGRKPFSARRHNPACGTHRCGSNTTPRLSSGSRQHTRSCSRRRIDGRLRVVLPAQRVLLRRLSLGEDRFLQRQLAERIAGEPAGEALAGEIRRAAERVADADVAVASIAGLAIQRKNASGAIRALLVQRRRRAFLSTRNSYQRTPPPPAAVFTECAATIDSLSADRAVDERAP